MQIEPSFWPQTALGWLTLAGIALTGFGAVIAFFRTIDKLNGYGSRLNEHIGEFKQAEGRLSAVESAVKLEASDRANLHSAVARLSTEVQTLQRIVSDGRLDRMEELGDIRERLVRIETKLDNKPDTQEHSHRRQ